MMRSLPGAWRRHPRVTAAVSALAVLLLAAGVTSAVAVHRLQGNIRAVDVTDRLGDDRPTAEPPADPDAGRPLNILVVGSDTRAGENDFIGGAEKDEGRSDTTIVLHVAADRGSALGVSIPRDSMVDMPGCTTPDGRLVPGAVRQFNDAYTIGGVACTQRVVEQLTGIRIDHYVVVDFAGFRQLVDALGGVEICLPRAVNDPLAKLDLPAGRQRVDGTTALAYVRTRHGLGDGGDLGRVARQQAFISAVLQQATSAGTLVQPKRLYDVLDVATRSVTVDPGLGSLTELAALARTVQSIGLDRISFLTVPTTEYPADRNRLAWSAETADLWRAVRKDLPVTTEPSTTATPPSATPPSATPPSATSPATPPATSADGAVRLRGVQERRADGDVCG